MKKAFVPTLFACIAAFCILPNCAGSGKGTAAGVSMDRALDMAAAAVFDALPSGTRVAVVQFSRPGLFFANHAPRI
jgi:hypothetical protein